uniref:Uncharacterized protein n=1 Tax=viral metagenome TaxID=1070528 RepID=A0A6C0FAU7_9ZZZZ
MLEINHVCSLGSLCHSSEILKRNKFKVCSYPFDWIFSNWNTIIHCIEDNFKTFLDKSYYIDISQMMCGHSKYNERMFAHHNPLINADHYNYYVRCVNRFKELLQKQEHKLFTMIFVNEEHNSHDVNFKKNIIDFNCKFSKYTSNYTLLVIINYPNNETNHHTFTYTDNIHFLNLYTLSLSDGSNFCNINDNIYLDNIIKKNYNFNIKN